MWCEEGVGCHELVANRALDGRFDFAFRAGGDASLVSKKVPRDEQLTYSFLNILAD